MQVQTNVQSQAQDQAPVQTIPPHIVERMESEWRQMRAGNSNSPASYPAATASK